MNAGGIPASDRTQTKRHTVKSRVSRVVSRIAGISPGVRVGILGRGASAVFRSRSRGPGAQISAERRTAIAGCRSYSAVIRVTVIIVIEELHGCLNLSDICQTPGVSGFLPSGV